MNIHQPFRKSFKNYPLASCWEYPLHTNDPIDDRIGLQIGMVMRTTRWAKINHRSIQRQTCQV